MMKPGEMMISDLRARTEAIDSMVCDSPASVDAIARRGARIRFHGASLDERLDQPRRPSLLLRPRPLVALHVDAVASRHAEIAEAASDALRHLLVLHDVDPVGLVVADALVGDLWKIAAAERRQHLQQVLTAIGKPCVPPQAPARSDERDQIARRGLVFEEPADRLLRALTLLLRQVHVVEEQHERAHRTRLTADVRRITVGAAHGNAVGRRRRPRRRRAGRTAIACGRPSSDTAKSDAVESADAARRDCRGRRRRW